MIYNKSIYKKLYTYFRLKLGAENYRRGWLKSRCPDCGRDGKFGINLFLAKTNCFVCGYNPSPLNLVRTLEGIESNKEVLKIVDEYKEGEYLAPILEKLEEVDVHLPEGYTNIALGSSFNSKLARDYIVKRGFDIDEMASKGWGYCSSGEFFGYIIMPFYMGGKLVYYNTRRYFGNGPKYKNPDIEDTGLGKSLVIYNSDALNIYREIYVLEGLINAETIGPMAISMGGKKISDYQLSALIKSPVSIINLLLDPDAIEEAIDVSFKLVYLKRLKLVYWDGDKDVNDLGREETLRRVNSTDFIDYKGLIKLKNSLNEKRSFSPYQII